MIRFSKQGITVNYNNDELTWLWWWNRKYREKYESLIYGTKFNNLKGYWMHVGSNEKPLGVSKIQGYSYESMILAWIKLNCRVGYYVVLYNVNVEAKPASFWRSIPDRDKKQLLGDVVILRCKDYDEMKQLVEAMPVDFATAAGISDGYIVYWNV